MNEGIYYYRKKGRWKNGEMKYAIEKDGNYICTVPRAEELIEILKLYGLKAKQNQNDAENEPNQNQTFAHELLSEPVPKAKNSTVNKHIIDEILEDFKNVKRK